MDDSNSEGRGFEREALVSALAKAWPRALIAEGRAEALAAWWIDSRRAAFERGLPALARSRLSKGLSDALFDARRARRVVRGLEAAEAALVALDVGVRQAASKAAADPSNATGPAVRRISRLLLLSADGSPRFYHQVDRLLGRYGERLEALVLECDELTLGETLFGPGQRVRAILIDHKDAVRRVLGLVSDKTSGEPEEKPE